MRIEPERAAREGLARIRAVLGRFDDVEERASHGEAAWFVRSGRQVAMFADRHHDERVALWVAAAPGMQESLVGARPERYFRPPYVGHRGWIGVFLDVECDWDEVGGLLELAVGMARTRGARGRR